MNQKKSYIKIVGASKVRELLQYLKDNGPTRYKELNTFIGTGTLNERLVELSESGLIQSERRGERNFKFYEPTEKGLKVLEWLQRIDEDVLKELTLRHVLEILEATNEKGKMRYTDLMEHIQQPPFLKLHELYDLGLLDHIIIRVERREEWYELTEKGKTVLQMVDEVVKIMAE